MKRKTQTISEPEPPARPVPAAPQPKPQDASEEVRASDRMLSVMCQLYDSIISAELQSGVYQLESGQFLAAKSELNIRGRYDALVEQITCRMIPAQAAKFREQFGRGALYDWLKNGKSSAEGNYCFAAEPLQQLKADAPDTSDGTDFGFSWYHFEALRISVSARGALRCFVTARSLENGDDISRPRTRSDDTDADPSRWDQLRAKKLLGNRQTLFFEYDTRKDTMTLHRDDADNRWDRNIPRYLRALTDRCDWTIFHDDVPAIHKLLKAGRGEIEIRYRAQGDYDQPFRWHRVKCARIDDKDDTSLILGALTDIHDELTLRETTKEMSKQLSSLIDITFADFFEIDAKAGTLARIVNKDGAYRKEERVKDINAALQADFESNAIHPDSQAEYRNWLTPGYLADKSKSANGYTFESRMRLPGDADYRWYLESITCPDMEHEPNKLLRLRRDVTAEHNENERLHKLQAQAAFSEYNQAMLDALAGVIEFRDAETGEHVIRVRNMTQYMLRYVVSHYPKYRMTKAEIDNVGIAATMHDVGKIAVPDSVLNKPGRLTKEEFLVMQSHTTKGAAIIDRLNLAESEELKLLCYDVVRHHHERYDGKGYPDHLVGEQISIVAQIVGVVDAYDALTSERVYKKAFSHEKAIAMLCGGECGAFGPVIIESLKACADKLRGGQNAQ